MKLFQYAVLLHGLKDEPSKLIVDVTTTLGVSQETAMLVAARAIPNEFMDRLSRIEVVVRPFMGSFFEEPKTKAKDRTAAPSFGSTLHGLSNGLKTFTHTNTFSPQITWGGSVLDSTDPIIWNTSYNNAAEVLAR